MKKYLCTAIVLILAAFFIVGCGKKDFFEMKEKHPATKTYRDGKWEIRYGSRTQDYTDRIKSTTFFMSFDVIEDLTEKEMLDIMDYYEYTGNAQWDMDGQYIGERKTDFTCYAVFFREGTEEEIRRIKYCNWKEVEIPEEEQSYFPKPVMYSDEYNRDGYNVPLS